MLRIQQGPDGSRTLTASRAVAFAVALLVLLVSLSAEAKKKKKASKKHKTPAARHTSKSKSKSTESDRGLPPVEAAPESDEASKEKEEKPAASPSRAATEGEGEEKAEKAPPPAEGEEAVPAKRPPAKSAKAASAAEPEAGGPGGPIALSLGVGGKALFRNLSWTDDMGALAPYKLSPGPEIAAWLEAYPAAFMTDGFAANIGVFGRLNYGLGATSTTPSGTSLTTKYQDFLGGLKVRFPLGMFLPYISGAYGMQKFNLEPFDPAGTRPNFDYAFIRVGGGTRIQVTPAFDADVSAGYLIVTNPGSGAGEVRAIYPGATANGVDVTVSLGFRVISLIGVRAGFDFRQFGLSTHWKTGDTALRAGGATDRNIGVWGGLEIVFDGLGGGGAEEEAPPAKKAPAGKAKAAPRDAEPDEEPAAKTGGAGADTDSDE